ncbi:DUF6382 domain-containing protein [Vallitalea guaymasensis]|uniref:DUF6382 domain-containing protein n=1 Tax=Vallitalea guaymasensis TaxID=1185412 RepID=UPI000DE53F7D|nr:DUF6382 domain-containing protein [Vallitalea guaymasensis]
MNTNITYERDAINSYLVIKADDDIHIEDYEVEMLERNSIDSFLDLNIRILNTEKKLYYNITSKQKLTEVLERKKLTSSDLNNFFANLIGIIKDCEKYYLNSNKILLHQDMIYINPNGFLPCYVYTPFDNCHRDILEDTKNIIEFFFDKVSQEDVNAVMIIHRLITACKQHDFNINTIENIINSSTSPQVQPDNKIQIEQDHKISNRENKSNAEDNFIISKLIEQNRERKKAEKSKSHKPENSRFQHNKEIEMTTKNKIIKSEIKPKQNKKTDNKKLTTHKKNYMHFIFRF